MYAPATFLLTKYMNIKNRKLISKKFDTPDKQKESYSCGYYAVAQAVEAKAKVMELIPQDDNIDPRVIMAFGKEGEPLWSPRQCYKRPIKTDKGHLIWVTVIQKIIEYSNDESKDDLMIVKDLIDMNCAVLVGLTTKGQKTDVDGIPQYIYNQQMPPRGHWVTAIDYDANFIYFSDSNFGKRSKIANKDFDNICSIVWVFTVAKCTPSFIYPVAKPHITQSFGARPEYYKQFGGQWVNGHMGLDFKTKTDKHPNGIGSDILAAHDGVAKEFISPAYGTYVEIESLVDKKLKTRYCHLSKSSIFMGQPVKAGQVIGLAGSTGNSTAPHLHFELLYDGKFLDPTHKFGTIDLNDLIN